MSCDFNMSADDDSERRKQSQPRVEPWKDKERLEVLYYEQDLTQYEIADKFGVEQPTIHYWMNQFDLLEPERDFYVVEVEGGKVQIHPAATDEQVVYVHQLVALLDHEPEDVFGEDTHVHHLMAAPHAVDIPENLVVWDAGTHIRRHAEGIATDDPEKVLQHLFGEFELDEIEDVDGTEDVDDA